MFWPELFYHNATTPDKTGWDKPKDARIFPHYREWKHSQRHRNGFPPLSPQSMLSWRFDGDGWELSVEIINITLKIVSQLETTKPFFSEVVAILCSVNWQSYNPLPIDDP